VPALQWLLLTPLLLFSDPTVYPVKIRPISNNNAANFFSFVRFAGICQLPTLHLIEILYLNFEIWLFLFGICQLPLVGVGK